MNVMSGERFTNARVHEWLSPILDEVTDTMHTTRLLLNSAAVWWFCRKMTPEQRAEILGEYVKIQALGGDATASARGKNTDGAAPGPRKRGRPRKHPLAGS